MFDYFSKCMWIKWKHEKIFSKIYLISKFTIFNCMSKINIHYILKTQYFKQKKKIRTSILIIYTYTVYISKFTIFTYTSNSNLFFINRTLKFLHINVCEMCPFSCVMKVMINWSSGSLLLATCLLIACRISSLKPLSEPLVPIRLCPRWGTTSSTTWPTHKYINSSKMSTLTM